MDPTENRVQALREQLLDLHEQNTTLQASADADGRELTEDEAAQVAANFEEFERHEAEIARREQLSASAARLTASLGRRTEDELPRAAPRAQALADDGGLPVRRNARIEPPAEDRGKWGWRSFGEFAMRVQAATRPGGAIMDPRLIANQPTTFGSEGTGADGGFAVPPDFRAAIMEKVQAEDSLLSRTDQQITSSNAMTFPTDETTPWQTSGGVLATWMDEGTQLTQSKPNLKQTTVRANKLGVLVPVTEELMEDAGSLDAYLRRKAPAKIGFSINAAIVDGDGAGKPLGILKSGARVDVAKETSQTADTIVYPNLTKMWQALYGPHRANAVWLVNQDIESQLRLMAFDGAAVDKVPAYLPPGGASATPYATLFGREVIPTQACKTLGDLGDIILVDLGEYLTVMKSGGVRAEVSMHLYFDYDMLAYRFIMRIGGQPWWASTIAALNGSGTYSAFVALAERA